MSSMTTTHHTDILVIGGGPGGATAATFMAEKGYSVTIVERDCFPRFQIGESLLPYNNDLFRKLGIWSELESRFYPKFGAEFLTGDGRVGYKFRFDRNLPQAYSKSFQVKRAEFDLLLIRHAEKKGVVVREGTTVTDVDLSNPELARVRVTSGGEPSELTARFVIDASGYGSVLGRRYGEKTEVESLRKVAIFAHYRNVVPSAKDENSGNTVIAILKDSWFWLIPLSDELTSVGLVVDRDDLKNSNMTPEALLEKAIEQTPYVAKRLAPAERTTEILVRRDFSYKMKNLYGTNYALLGDAAGFIDPIFSTGVFIAMKSADLVANAADEWLRRHSQKGLKRYARSLRYAMRQYFNFISNFYRREFLEVFLQPHQRFGLLPPVVGVLAGNVFDSTPNRWKLRIFFTLVELQKRLGVIAPRISWDTLPAASTLRLTSEEHFV